MATTPGSTENEKSYSAEQRQWKSCPPFNLVDDLTLTLLSTSNPRSLLYFCQSLTPCIHHARFGFIKQSHYLSGPVQVEHSPRSLYSHRLSVSSLSRLFGVPPYRCTYWSFAEQNVIIIHNFAIRIVNKLKLLNRDLKLSRTEYWNCNVKRSAQYGLRTTDLVHCHSDVYNQCRSGRSDSIHSVLDSFPHPSDPCAAMDALRLQRKYPQVSRDEMFDLINRFK